jgi:hypothetical protein
LPWSIIRIFFLDTNVRNVTTSIGIAIWSRCRRLGQCRRWGADEVQCAEVRSPFDARPFLSKPPELEFVVLTVR